MPNVNLTDQRGRDAVVKAESIRTSEPVRYVGPGGQASYTRRVLKSTVDHDYDTLVEAHGGPEELGAALVDGDPEIDLERFGQFLWNVSKVYIDPEEEIVFRVEQFEVVEDPEGELVERRPRERLEANVDSDVPLSWTGTLVPKADAARRFVFASKLQIVHVNGLTYDFLHGIASDLAEADSMLLMGAGRTGTDPLVFRRGSTPYRGFLEGRVEGDRYVLLLHLSNTELRRPAIFDRPPAEPEAEQAPDGSSTEDSGGSPAGTAPDAASAPADSNDAGTEANTEKVSEHEKAPAKEAAVKRSSAKKATAKVPTKQAASKKAAAKKKSVAKKSPAKKKAAAKKAPAKKKAAAKKAPAKKKAAPKKKAPAKKKAAPKKKAPAKKTAAAKKVPAKKKAAPKRKAPAKKTAAAKKVPAKKKAAPKRKAPAKKKASAKRRTKSDGKG